MSKINDVTEQFISLLVIGFSSESEQSLREMLEDQAVRLTFVSSVEQAKQCILLGSPSLYSAYLFDNSQHYAANLSLLKGLKKHYQYSIIPVIFQTDSEHTEQIQQSLESGVYFYLVKPYTKSLLLSVLKACINGFSDQCTFDQIERSLTIPNQQLQSARFQIKTTEDARSLSCVLAFMTPKPKESVIGLFELMMNAIEHGNLNISYQEKTQLIDSNFLNEEIRKRQALPENKDKLVTVDFERKEGELLFRITDSGKGFDYKPYLDFSLDRVMDNHGRGVMIANRLSFDELRYDDCGRTAIGRIFL